LGLDNELRLRLESLTLEEKVEAMRVLTDSTFVSSVGKRTPREVLQSVHRNRIAGPMVNLSAVDIIREMRDNR